MQPDYRTTQSLFEGHLTQARRHLTIGETSFALREFREALRLRPRDGSVRSEIERLNMIVSPHKSQSRIVPSERIRSLFNLTIRYWDNNMPSAALKEVYTTIPEQ